MSVEYKHANTAGKEPNSPVTSLPVTSRLQRTATMEAIVAGERASKYCRPIRWGISRTTRAPAIGKPKKPPTAAEA